MLAELVDRIHNLNRTAKFWQCKTNLSSTEREFERLIGNRLCATKLRGIDISGLRACAVWNARGLHERGIGEVNSFGSQLHGKDIQQLTFFWSRILIHDCWNSHSYYLELYGLHSHQSFMNVLLLQIKDFFLHLLSWVEASPWFWRKTTRGKRSAR